MRSWRDLIGNVGERARFQGSGQRSASKYADTANRALGSEKKHETVACCTPLDPCVSYKIDLFDSSGTMSDL